MNIKKVDDKPMSIHTKEKMKLHVKAGPEAKIKGRNVLSVEKNPVRKEKQKREKHANKKKGTIGAVTAVGAMKTLDQIEGGNEVYEAYHLAKTLTAPAESAVKAGRRLYRSQMFKEQEKKVKKVQAGQKIKKKASRESAVKTAKYTAKKVSKETAKETAKAAAKETAKVTENVAATTAAITAGTAIAPGIGTAAGFGAGTAVGYATGVKMDYEDMKAVSKNRKLKFFLDKLNAEEKQKDSIAKLVKDLLLNKVSMLAKAAAPIIGLLLLLLAVVITVVAVPVIAIIVIVYNSPFAMFFPSISSGDTMQNVLSAYVEEFNAEVNAEVNHHSGYDISEKIYIDFEGAGAPDNYYDILAVYMVKHGNGDTAIDMTDKARDNLKAVFDDMCSYSISDRTDIDTDAEGNSVTTTVKEVNVVLKTYRNMISEYCFEDNEEKMLIELMKPEYLALIGWSDNPGETVSPEQYQAIVDSISDASGKKVVEYALAKVGYPYSQEYRDSGDYYDCSSLAYYAWQNAGVNIMYEGANTAAAEGKLCYDKHYLVPYDEMQPGDLIFYSYGNNGRFFNITHVAIYVGDGKVVEAVDEKTGVVYRSLRNQASIVFIGRPRQEGK